MRIFDAHCDTLSHYYNLEVNSGHFDLTRAQARGGGMQVMAAFGGGQLDQLTRLAVAAREFCFAYPDITLIPAVESGDQIRHTSDLDDYIALGVRYFGLTWNHDNRLGGGCDSRAGLTPLGRDCISLLEQARVTIDLSHASDTTFYDVLACTARPPVVTHACCRALCGHRRNLDDGQMAALAKAGGVLGITLYTPFLSESGAADIDVVCEHITHAVSIMGEDCVGLGSDLDGCDRLPDNIRDTSDLPSVIERLPFPCRIREKIACCNFARTLL